MLNIAICDDTKEDIAGLTELIADYMTLHPELDIKTEAFSSPDELLFEIDGSTRYDLYILDILMPNISGIDAGKKIRETDADAAIVFTTTSADYALDAYSLYAFQYILKPIAKNDFFGMMDHFLISHKKAAAVSFPVKTSEGTVNVHLNTISHIECRGHTAVFLLADKSSVTSNHIRIAFTEYIAPLLADGRFVITHKSYAANMDLVARLSSQALTMSNGMTVPVSRKNYPAVKQKYLDYVSAGISGK